MLADSKDKDGNTPLHLAAREGNKEEVELLLKGGAQVDLQNEDGHTALHAAAREGNKGVVELLLEKGADPNCKDKDGNNALILAADRGHEEVVKLLLKGGAQVDLQNEDGDTPLSIAARKGYEGVVELLLKERKGGMIDQFSELILSYGGDTAQEIVSELKIGENKIEEWLLDAKREGLLSTQVSLEVIQQLFGQVSREVSRGVTRDDQGQALSTEGPEIVPLFEAFADIGLD